MTLESSPRDQKLTPSSAGIPAMPAYLTFYRYFFASCVVLAPLMITLYALLNPTPMHVTAGAIAISANIAANPIANQLHLVLGVLLSFLLPFAFLGMAWLALPRAPWLATIAGLLSLVGWIPWSALIGQEALTSTMARMGSDAQFAALWERFNGNFVLTSYLLIYIVGHLLSTVLLGISLGRSRVVPIWVAWALVLISPLQIVAFVMHQLAVIIVACLLWLVSSIPIARALLRCKGDHASQTVCVE